MHMIKNETEKLLDNLTGFGKRINKNPAYFHTYVSEMNNKVKHFRNLVSENSAAISNKFFKYWDAYMEKYNQLPSGYVWNSKDLVKNNQFINDTVLKSLFMKSLISLTEIYKNLITE